MTSRRRMTCVGPKIHLFWLYYFISSLLPPFASALGPFPCRVLRRSLIRTLAAVGRSLRTCSILAAYTVAPRRSGVLLRTRAPLFVPKMDSKTSLKAFRGIAAAKPCVYRSLYSGLTNTLIAHDTHEQPHTLATESEHERVTKQILYIYIYIYALRLVTGKLGFDVSLLNQRLYYQIRGECEGVPLRADVNFMCFVLRRYNFDIVSIGGKARYRGPVLQHG